VRKLRIEYRNAQERKRKLKKLKLCLGRKARPQDTKTRQNSFEASGAYISQTEEDRAPNKEKRKKKVQESRGVGALILMGCGQSREREN